MSGFLDITFPHEISYGSVGGIEFSTNVAKLANGSEVRTSINNLGRCVYNILPGIKTAQQLGDIVSFFRITHGRLSSFRFRDWNDYYGKLQPLVKISNNVYQMQKIYQIGSNVFKRKITKPIAGKVEIFQDGTQITNGFTIDYSLGQITFAAPPPSNATLLSNFEFDVHSRFDSDTLEVIMDNYQASQIKNILIVEVYA
jgi:uncharacterized protein (TIGR02217 family)